MRPACERFEEKYEEAEDGCWNWTASVDKDGYGRFRPGTTPTSLKIRAHRFAYLLHVGDIDEGGWVLHTCDNPGCVNPEHLYVGTPKQNALDRERRGRSNLGRDHLGRFCVNARV